MNSPTPYEPDPARIKRHARKIVEKRFAIAEVMDRFKHEMAEANRLVGDDVRAGVEHAMLAMGDLLDALGIEKGAALKVLEGIEDLRRGATQPWLVADDQFGGNRTDAPEKACQTMAVAARIVIEVEDGLTIRESARLVAGAIAKHRPKVHCGTVEGWGERIADISPSPDYLRALIDSLRQLKTDDVLTIVSESFATAR